MRDIRQLHQQALRKKTAPNAQVDRRVRLRALAREAKRARDEGHKPDNARVVLSASVRPTARPNHHSDKPVQDFTNRPVSKPDNLQEGEISPLWTGRALPGTAAERAAWLHKKLSAASFETRPELKATVNLARQEMVLTEGDLVIAVWPVSSGKKGFETTEGQFTSQWLSRNHRSREYNNAPMPCSVFFHQGEAFHGTTETHKLGSPASHGCVRLATENACALHDMVQKRGARSLSVSIVR